MSKLRAPLSKILPSFIPVFIERGLPEYMADNGLTPGESRLSATQVRSLLAASAFLGTLDYVGQRLDLDFDRLNASITDSLQVVSELTPDEINLAFQLIDAFYKYKFIRENHAFDDWLCEARWPIFQNTPYRYPSPMSGIVSCGLTIRLLLDKCTLEY